MRFQDSVVLVTGAGRGLGRAIALAFGREGARLAVNDLTPVNLDETEAQLSAIGVDCLVVTCDVSKKSQLQAMLEQVVDRFGRLDVLVNNAGVQPTGTLLTLDEWDWDRTLAVNLKGPFLAMQSAARLMRDQGGGVIVNLGGSGLQGEALRQQPAYAASKQGLIALSRAAALELAPDNIRVNVVALAGGSSLRLEGGSEPGPRTNAVAEAVLYLCSPQAGFITGEVLSMDEAEQD